MGRKKRFRKQRMKARQQRRRAKLARRLLQSPSGSDFLTGLFLGFLHRAVCAAVSDVPLGVEDLRAAVKTGLTYVLYGPKQRAIDARLLSAAAHQDKDEP